MIGWTHVASRDYAELVVNDRLDEDLDEMILTLQNRRASRTTPRCSECGELLYDSHRHIMRDGLGREWIVAVTVLRPSAGEGT